MIRRLDGRRFEHFKKVVCIRVSRCSILYFLVHLFIALKMLEAGEDAMERKIEKEISEAIDEYILADSGDSPIAPADEAVLFIASFVSRKS